jgi:hypothetical protein
MRRRRKRTVYTQRTMAWMEGDEVVILGIR